MPFGCAVLCSLHVAVLTTHFSPALSSLSLFPSTPTPTLSASATLPWLCSVPPPPAVANVLPKGMYVENAVKVAKRELALECDYRFELAAQQRFKLLVEGDPRTSRHFRVPAVVPELSSERVLTSERVAGVHIDRVALMGQEVRDAVGTRLLALTLQELFEWRFMQVCTPSALFSMCLLCMPVCCMHIILSPAQLTRMHVQPGASGG